MSKNEIKKKNISANALSDDNLEDVAGGSDPLIPHPKPIPKPSPEAADRYEEWVKKMYPHQPPKVWG